jgi:hypothetical protein
MFVKLWQFDPADRRHVRLNTRKMALVDDKERCGVTLMPLFKDAHEAVRLEQWAPGAAIELEPDGGLEVLVLEGGFSEGGDSHGYGCPLACISARAWPLAAAVRGSRRAIYVASTQSSPRVEPVTVGRLGRRPSATALSQGDVT